jgi:hypothetical protein
MMTRKSEEMLVAFERKILRRIYGPKKVEGVWRLRYNTEICDLYKEVKVSLFIKLRRLQGAGRVMRMYDERIPKKALQQTVYGKRAVGKPRKRWEDAVWEDCIKLLGMKAWKTKGKVRQIWRQCIEKVKARYGL